MNQKNIAWPDVVSREPDAVMLVDADFLKLMGDEDPDELVDRIYLEQLERHWAEEFEDELHGW
jgi:hypothetical protein